MPIRYEGWLVTLEDGPGGSAVYVRRKGNKTVQHDVGEMLGDVYDQIDEEENA